MDEKYSIRNILLQFKLGNKNLDESVNAIFSALDKEITLGTVCPDCGYPKFKRTFEKFERCHGCEWTSKDD